jgi:4-carboxymuconolactone decarboxylase
VLIGQHWESPYVIDAHIKYLRKTGMAEAVLEALQNRREPPLESEREKAIYALWQAFDRKEVAGDDVFEHAAKVLGRDGLAELIAFLGYYTAVSMAMKVHRMPVAAK